MTKAYGKSGLIFLVLAGSIVLLSGFLSFAQDDQDVPAGIEGDSFHLRPDEYADDEDHCSAGTFYKNGKCVPHDLNDCCDPGKILFEDGKCYDRCQCTQVSENSTHSVCTCEGVGKSANSLCSGLDMNTLCCDNGFKFNKDDSTCYTEYECNQTSSGKECAYGGIARATRLSCPVGDDFLDDFDKPEKCCDDGYDYMEGKCYENCELNEDDAQWTCSGATAEPVECKSFEKCCAAGRTFIDGKCYKNCTCEGTVCTCPPATGDDDISEDPTECQRSCCDAGYVYKDGKCYGQCTTADGVTKCLDDKKAQKPCRNVSEDHKCCPENYNYKDGKCYEKCECTGDFCTCSGDITDPEADCKEPKNECCEDGYYLYDQNCYPKPVCGVITITTTEGCPEGQESCQKEVEQCQWSATEVKPVLRPECKKIPNRPYRD